MLPDKEDFSTNLNMEDITNTDYRHAEKSMEKFLNEKSSEYHDLYVQSDILLLAYVFEIFHNKCIKINELDPAHFLSAPGLAWLVCLKKPKVESELLTDIDMLLMIEKDIRGEKCHSVHRYARTNNKYIKNYNTDI